MAQFLTGNEAVARGAYEAGLSFASAYPGTPSTEILENMAALKDELIAEWAPNEKVALESAIGASIAGARALSTMKMVGVNVAADPLFSFAYSGVNGGLVLVSADDPGMHSSQNEQDNRQYAPFAKIPMFEPSDSQEAHDMVIEAFEVSETYDAPVLFRMTTRVCHSKSLVKTGERKEEVLKPYEKLPKFDLIPANSRKLRVDLEARLRKLEDYAENCRFNRIEDNGSEIGVIGSGVGFTYAQEVFGADASYLKLGMTYPLPRKLIADFAAKVKVLYVVEELEPYLENQIKLMGIECIGKDRIPGIGELNPTIVAKALKGEDPVQIDLTDVADKVVGRPPVLCAGCPHRGFFVELANLSKKRNLIISGDIGCYGLGGADPLNAKDICICMGASASIAHGAQTVMNKFGKDARLVATMGDSTFFHTGMNSLVNVVYNKSNTITCILDNRITGMTGQQENPSTGFTLQGAPTKELEIEPLVRALGVEHVRTVDPNDLRSVRGALTWAVGLDEPSVIITKWPCVLKKLNEEEAAQYQREAPAYRVEPDVCTGCMDCINIGCPAISLTDGKKALIDEVACDGCGVCEKVCKHFAIDPVEEE
ncbi:indolepyruvate ferredoxin oxidoreductase subunit alpha [uncultured Cohaesibacter sp.]|uniref:indolepyruvate ferredoxin oxidoreductase subunit alpha n=1 Tax=uncultured Cohaesibacter sp. TaxID=1002546 RepID=UPI00292DC069|nr:indolepyruvate ferredoxin oxidoreductase subunit alpha [uncultured Cohaesibacter sp.]